MSDKTNIFAAFQDKKAKVRSMADAALSSGLISNETFAEIVEKVESDVLTIGIIGQTNSGKSTFLNALLFGRPVLPISSTPMTAGLTVITYGVDAGLSVEFYSHYEWQEIVALSDRTVGDGDDPQLVSAVRAAKEMVKASEPITDELPALLGATKADDFLHLAQYVGAGGRYVPVVKYVRIFLPYEW
ncbi:MAG: dynamin family protein, partial [Muribaculaceae bacterium]|nr:dynamin family protein [Muribaculaceae bacterium]